MWKRIVMPVVGSLLITSFMHIAGCQPMIDTEKLKQELITTDKEFSAMSEAKGMRAAFGAYMADDVVIYRGGVAPIEGRANALPLYPDNPDVVLTWSPWRADVAASGELGYTLGSYSLRSVGADGAVQESTGNYVSIWKRQADGTWKFVFDTGHPGPRRDSAGGQ